MNGEIEREVLYGRDPDSLRVFVSSRMGQNLDAERQLAATTIDGVQGHRSWLWERDAAAGAYCSWHECVGFAAASDGIVLLIAGDLSDVVRAEYGAARDAGAQRYIFIRDTEAIPDDVEAFIDVERDASVTRNYRNPGELRTHLLTGLTQAFIRSAREAILARRDRAGPA